ncbi:MAG: hypothetical protein AAGK78_00420, partial [Planctomycetota bacterium]
FRDRLVGQHGSERVRVLVRVHGTGGSGEEGFDEFAAQVEQAFDHDVLLVAPTFDVPYHFLLPAADEALLQHLRHISKRLALHERLLITGFSGGGQFAHRFALQHPEHVHACAPLAAGSWTSPGGEFFGMMDDEGWLDRPGWNKQTIHDVAHCPAAGHWQHIHWLVGVGNLDHPSRVESARRFHQSLVDAGGHGVFRTWRAAHELLPSIEAEVLAFLCRASHANV